MRLYLLLLSCFIIASCSKQPDNCRTVTCSSHGADLFFSGYTAAELDTVILKEYTPDSSFTNLQKTSVLIHPDSFHQLTVTGFTHHTGLIPTKDYEVTIVKTNQTFKIHLRNLITEKVMCGNGRSCANDFQSPLISGGEYTAFSTSPSTYYLGLKK